MKTAATTTSPYTARTIFDQLLCRNPPIAMRSSSPATITERNPRIGIIPPSGTGGRYPSAPALSKKLSMNGSPPIKARRGRLPKPAKPSWIPGRKLVISGKRKMITNPSSKFKTNSTVPYQGVASAPSPYQRRPAASNLGCSSIDNAISIISRIDSTAKLAYNEREVDQ